MSCIWNIPREERHCEYCLVSCGEREMQYTTSATNTVTIVPIPNNTIVSGGGEEPLAKIKHINNNQKLMKGE